MEIYEEISRLKREGKRAALATIVNVSGSVPPVVAAKMLVREDGSIMGTVGGGRMESEVREEAMATMRNEKPKTLTFNMDQTTDDETGLVCGGSLDVFIEPLIPSPVLYIFGGGHVGLSLYKVAMLAGFEVVVADDREPFANRDRFPDAREIHAGDMDTTLSELAPNSDSYIAIVTRGHRHDIRVLRWALNTPAQYIGMIGSGRKVLSLFQKLEEEGVARDSIERVFGPIGLEINAGTPEEIAISIVAELIAVRRHCSIALPHLRNRIRKEPADSLSLQE